MKAITLLLIASTIGLYANQSVAQLNPPGKFPTQRLQANLGEGCRFAVTLFGKKGAKSPIDSSETGVGGDLNIHSGGMVATPYPGSWKSKMTALGFGLDCLDKENPDLENAPTNYNGAKYDKSKKLWEKDLDAWFNSWEPTKEERKIADKATRVINIKAVNARGYAQLTDDTIGDEIGRRREMNFCLFHPPKALCGTGTVAQLADGPKGDLTKYALEILKSIEFLEDANPDQSTPSQ